MALLTVKLDSVAAMRNVRRLPEPDPAQAAVLAELAGVDGIAIQLRRDRRFIRDRDLYILREVVKTKLMIEIPPTDELIDRVLEVKPSMVTFVADHPDNDTPVSGIDFANAPVDFSSTAARFKAVGVGVCFLIEPTSDAVKGAVKSQADAILVNCSGFTRAQTLEDAQRELDRIDNTLQAAAKTDLAVQAGRGIDYKSILALHELNLIDEFVIGHAIVARGLLRGLENAVKDMTDLLQARAK